MRKNTTGQNKTALSVPAVMERLLNESFWDQVPSRWMEPWPTLFSPLSANFGLDFVIPSADISETEKEILLEIEVPGYEPKDIRVDITPEMVSIEGKMEQESEEKGKKYSRRERVAGEFFREFSLPNYADSAKAVSKIKNGVLRIAIPKKPEAEKKHLKVEIES